MSPVDTAESSKDLDPLSRWPRRLLHVPTMTSQEWKPGNRYGDYVEPSYNILSYTWGRYELKAEELPDVRAVDIKGVSWRIPRINPTHFSSQDFASVIQRSCKIRCPGAKYDKPNGSDPDHLWLDVACIDQEDDTMKLAEVGRQALFFAHAETALIWLSHHHYDQLDRAIDLFHVAMLRAEVEHQRPLLENERRENWVEWAIEALEIVLIDPWFSSLWTLQEAFLRKDAILLPLEGDPITHREEVTVVDLRYFTILCNVLAIASPPEFAYLVNNDDLLRVPHLKSLIQKSSLGLLYSDSPVALYTGARYRTTSHQLDRIYGIMQTFGFRLGSTAEHSKTNQRFTLEELEDQLGAALLQKWPIRSQCHVHTQQVDYGRSWHISQSSDFPNFVLEYEKGGEEDWYVSQCQLSTTSRNNKMWGLFKGSTCVFEKLANAWRAWSDSLLRKSSHTYEDPPTKRSYRGSIQSIALDATEALKDAPESLASLNQLNIPDSGIQNDVASTLVQMFHDRLIVLKLSKGMGLILLNQHHQEPGHWHRLGICKWDLKETTDEFLLGSSDPRWKETEGLFG